MKKLMITGGLVGFLIGVGVGLATEGSSWPGVIWRASVAAMLGGWMLRWWGGVWVGCVQHACLEQRAAMERAEAQNQSAKQ